MLSRKTALALADVYVALYIYSYETMGHFVTTHTRAHLEPSIDTHRLYDFLYAHDYEAWFCNGARKLHTPVSPHRHLKEFFLKVHTGETLVEGTPNWTWEDRAKLGQRYLQDLAEDIYNDWRAEFESLRAHSKARHDEAKVSALIDTLRARVELDGYAFRNGRLLAAEGNVLNVEEETGLLESLYKTRGLGNEQVTFNHLTLSEEHYIESRWGDAIANARQFLESVLRETASKHSLQCLSTPLPANTYTRPVNIRDYLQREGLLEGKEKDALASVYGLLSNTGSHPYMAQEDQARLLRQLALTLAQFVMLRAKGALGIK